MSDAASDIDDKFYDRVDAHIGLSNEHLIDQPDIGLVSGSTLYAAARFNAFAATHNFDSAAEMQANRANILTYFMEQYRAMLEHNVDEYIAHYDAYVNDAPALPPLMPQT